VEVRGAGGKGALSNKRSGLVREQGLLVREEVLRHFVKGPRGELARELMELGFGLRVL
jgi:hypothetical protein